MKKYTLLENKSFMENKSRVKKLEQSEERTPDNPEVLQIQASQTLTSKSENITVCRTAVLCHSFA